MKRIARKDISFVLVYFIYIFFEALSQTEMSFSEIKYIKWMCLVWMFIRILTETKIKKSQLLWWAIFGILCVLVGWKSSDMLKVLSVCVFTYAAINVNSTRLVKTALAAITLVLLLIPVLSYSGLIPFVVSNVGGRLRYNLGFKYATFSSNFFLHAVAMWLFIKKDKIRAINIAFILAINYIIYLLTDTRATNIEILFIVIILLISNSIDKLSESKIRVMYNNAFIGGCIISMALQIFYNKSKGWMLLLNTALNYRLSLGKYAFNDFGISFLGQYVQWNSFDRAATEEYYYVDSSYMNISIVYGIVILLILVIGFSILIQKYVKENDRNKCNALLLLAVHSMMNPQLFNLLYDPFLFVMIPYLIKKISEKDIRRKNG